VPASPLSRVAFGASVFLFSPVPLRLQFRFHPHSVAGDARRGNI